MDFTFSYLRTIVGQSFNSLPKKSQSIIYLNPKVHWWRNPL